MTPKSGADRTRKRNADARFPSRTDSCGKPGRTMPPAWFVLPPTYPRERIPAKRGSKKDSRTSESPAFLLEVAFAEEVQDVHARDQAVEAGVVADDGDAAGVEDGEQIVDAGGPRDGLHVARHHVADAP